MAGKIIEIVVLLLGLLITAAIVITIPLKSYNEYKDYLAQIEEANKAQIKPTLESITAELKEGVRYFANDIAEVRAEDLIVTAHFSREDEKFSELVEEGAFTVETPADFYSHGGDVVVKYKNKTFTLNIQLEPLVMERLEIVSDPYTIHYAEGNSFNASGMIVRGIYNDGSSKILGEDEYEVDTSKALTTADKKVEVSYKAGEATITTTLDIQVSTTVNNGDVKSLVIVGDPIVNAGSTVDTASVVVNAVYENGNRKLLSSDEYTITGSTEPTKFGKSYELTVSYNADTTKTVKAKAIVRQTIQGESGTIVGGASKAETEYAVIDGAITELDNKVTFAGSFSETVKKGDVAYLVLTLNSESLTTGNITLRCSNSYNVYANGVNDSGGYMMKPLQINTILDVTINGRDVKVPATVILKGCGPWKEYAPLYGIYYEFTIEGVQLDPGVNEVKFQFKKSTVGATNCWGESPSTLNIDYVNFDTLGNEIPDNYEIEKIEIPEGFNVEFKQSLDSVKNVNLLAVITGGAKIALTPDKYDVKITGVKEGETYFKFRTYTIEYSLKDDPNVKVSYEFTIEEFESFTVLNVYIQAEGNKVYYVLTGDCTGYTEDKFVFYGNSTKYPMIMSFDEDTFEFKVDITNLSIGDGFTPIITVDGKNYANGVNGSGEVTGHGIKFTDGQSVCYNNQRYFIKATNGVPCVAVKEQVSDKDFLANFVYGSSGCDTNGQDKNSDYPGGIGNLDAKDRYVSYTFTLTEAGKVDFVWYIAGNKWNGSTQSNDGITDMSKHMTVTIDGKTLNVSGIALPAGTGDATDIWWNIQKVVFKDIELQAGTHTFKCLITGSGGLNVAAMEIYFAEN